MPRIFRGYPKDFKNLKPKCFICVYISAGFAVPSQTTCVWLRQLFYEGILFWHEDIKISKIQNSAISDTVLVSGQVTF